MPPQATEVSVAPREATYMTTRVENRPWYDAELEEDYLGALKQEDRPSRKGTSIDLHFQSRVNRRKLAYRSIIKGEEEPEPLPDDPVAAMEDPESHASSKETQSKAEAARVARQKRLQNIREPQVDPKANEATKIRVMRAQRLRNSLKLTADDEDAQEALRLRRLQQAEADRIERKKQDEQEKSRQEELGRLEEERRLLAQERKELEMAKRRAQAQMERNQPASPSYSKEQKEKPKAKPRRKSRRKARRQEKCDLDDEPSLLEELQLLVRESGILRTCVTSCFGDEEDLYLRTRVEHTSSRKKSSRHSKPEVDEQLDSDLDDLELNEV